MGNHSWRKKCDEKFVRNIHKNFPVKLRIACENIIDVKLSLSLKFIDLVPRPHNFNDFQVFADGVRIMRIAA